MCSVDVTPDVWYWDNRVKKNKEVLDVVHRCRDFDRIRQWALEYRSAEDLDAIEDIIE